ncbi:MAG: sugar phosphate nucleotidyltransferase [Actinomycetales bacterium]
MKPNINKAIFLVGGKGTRLAPLTNVTPKPMIRIAGAPVTEHQILRARDAGVKEIVLATSYLAEVFEPHFGNGRKFGVSIKYAVEKEPLGTGGAIANAAQLLDLDNDESIFIFNGDVLSNHDLNSQSELHFSTNADATLHLIEVADARAYGCVPLGSNNQVLEFLEKMPNPKANSINAGCYIFKSETISQIPVNKVVSIERDSFPSWLISGSAIYGYLDSSYWIDMGTPESMIKASRDLVLQNHGENLISPSAKINSGALVIGGSYVEAGAIIEAGAEISGSIIGEAAVVESGSIVKNSYVSAKSRVKSGSKLSEIIHGF